MLFNEEQEKLIDAVIGEQLACREPGVSTHRDGAWSTELTPVFSQALPAENILDLSGDWAVTLWPFEKDEKVLVSPELQDSDWNRKAQPGKIFSTPVDKDPENTPNWDRISMRHINPEDGAVIRRTIRIPADWEGREIFIDCDGIYPAGRVYVNGQLVADHRSGLTPVCRNITELVKPGQNVLVAVRLVRNHKYIMMDMPRHSNEFGGMQQPVFLFAKDKCHVVDYYLPAVLDETLKHGAVDGYVTMCNKSDAAVSGKLSLDLRAPDGSFAASGFYPYTIAAGETVNVPVKLEVENPSLWNDEHPNLYKAELSTQVEGNVGEKYNFRPGFRRMDFKDCRAYLNGNPVKFRGVNHLTGHPQHGLYTPKEWLRRNFELMKLANVNCIRTHFMGPRWLAELCDEMGIYLCQELPVDWGTNYIHSPEWVGPGMLRVESGVLRDRNHPSVMIWSVGNENMPNKTAVAADGWMHLHLYERLVKKLDPHGLTMFPPPGPATNIDGIFEVRVGDVADMHYSFRHVKNFLANGEVENPLSWEADKEICTKEDALKRGWTGTWFSSEYCAFSAFPDIIRSPNCCSIIDDEWRRYPENATTLEVFDDRLKREWGFMRNEPTCLGGAYFPWMCHGSSTHLGHPFSWTILSEDCDWGVMTPELIPKPEFWSLRNLMAPVWFPDEIKWYQGDDFVTFELWNQYNDINLSECTIRITGMNTTMRWRDVKVTLAPGEKKMIQVPFWNDGMKGDLERGNTVVDRFWFIDPKGFITTVRDVAVVPAGHDRKSVGAEFDVSPEPAYIAKKAGKDE